MLATIRVMPRTDARGAIGKTRATARGAKEFSTKPATTGSKTTWNVLPKSPHTSTSTRAPASNCVRNGVITTAASVEHRVMTTERATSARAR